MIRRSGSGDVHEPSELPTTSNKRARPPSAASARGRGRGRGALGDRSTNATPAKPVASSSSADAAPSYARPTVATASKVAPTPRKRPRPSDVESPVRTAKKRSDPPPNEDGAGDDDASRPRSVRSPPVSPSRLKSPPSTSAQRLPAPAVDAGDPFVDSGPAQAGVTMRLPDELALPPAPSDTESPDASFSGPSSVLARLDDATATPKSSIPARLAAPSGSDTPVASTSSLQVPKANSTPVPSQATPRFRAPSSAMRAVYIGSARPAGSVDDPSVPRVAFISATPLPPSRTAAAAVDAEADVDANLLLVPDAADEATEPVVPPRSEDGDEGAASGLLTPLESDTSAAELSAVSEGAASALANLHSMLDSLQMPRRRVSDIGAKSIFERAAEPEAQGAYTSRSGAGTVARRHSSVVAAAPAAHRPVSPNRTAIKSAFLNGCEVYLDVRTEAGEDASAVVKKSLQSMGARVTTRTTGKITHVVFKSGHDATIQRVNKHPEPKPKLVGIGWVSACREAQAHVPEDDYLIPIETVEPLQKVRSRSVDGADSVDASAVG